MLKIPPWDLLAVSEIVSAAVWRVQAIQVEIAAANARSLAVAFDLATLTFIAAHGSEGADQEQGCHFDIPGDGDITIALRSRLTRCACVALALLASLIAR